MLATGVVVGAVAFSAGRVLSQDEGGQGGAGQDMTALLAEHRKTVEQHEEMARWAGVWDGDITMYMDPTQPTRSRGTTTSKSVLGGRYLFEETEGEFGGMAFEGFAIQAYDKKKQKYVTVWVDNFGTGIGTFEGTREGDVITLLGPPEEWGGMTYSPKGVVRRLGPDHHTYTMFGVLPSGVEFKMMEIRYTRRGHAPLEEWPTEEPAAPPPAADPPPPDDE
jgi:hypothetical protein